MSDNNCHLLLLPLSFINELTSGREVYLIRDGFPFPILLFE